MVSNGRLSSSALTSVQGSIKLSVKTARAYKRLIEEAAEHGHTIRIAAPAGGYRTYFVQGDMHVHPAKYGLNPHSNVSLAPAGHSSHGWGDRVDLVGASLDYIIPLAHKYGFTREFGAADPNHFKHDGVTAVSDPKKTARPGHIVYTLQTGKPNVAFWKNMQWAARAYGYRGTVDGKLGTLSWTAIQKGLKHYGYTGVVDGKPGVNTYKALQRLASHYGYNGPIDGKLGTNSYKALAKYLNTVK